MCYPDLTILRMGTRGSLLAIAQARQVANCLQKVWPKLIIEQVIISTKGDLDSRSALASFGGKGAFTTELEEALLSQQIDFAVHSFKDLPTEMRPELTLADPPLRASALDCIIGPELSELKPRSKVGTGSLRRYAQLRKLRPDLVYLPIRGNLNTRISKWQQGEYDAIVVAQAGIERLGLEKLKLSMEQVHPLPPEVCLPAAGQGALALQYRRNDTITADLLAALAHTPTAQAVLAERSLLATLGQGCHSPLAAHAEVQEELITLKASWMPDPIPERELCGCYYSLASQAQAAGYRLARAMQAQETLSRGTGADTTAISLRPLQDLHVVLAFSSSKALKLQTKLRHLGAKTLVLPVLEIKPLPIEEAADLELEQKLPHYDWLVFTSTNAVNSFFAKSQRLKQLAPKVSLAVVGPQTAKALKAFGLSASLIASQHTGESLGRELVQLLKTSSSAPSLLLVQAPSSLGNVASALKDANLTFETLMVYQSKPVMKLAEPDRLALNSFSQTLVPKAAPTLDSTAIVFAGSPSIVRAWARLTEGLLTPQQCTILAIGPSTALQASQLGYSHTLTSPVSSYSGMLDYLLAKHCQVLE